MLEAEDLASFVSLYKYQEHEPSDKVTEHALRIRGKGRSCCERDSEERLSQVSSFRRTALWPLRSCVYKQRFTKVQTLMVGS
jgi:hypothetical protein